jgi:hypothetical protein
MTRAEDNVMEIHSRRRASFRHQTENQTTVDGLMHIIQAFELETILILHTDHDECREVRGVHLYMTQTRKIRSRHVSDRENTRGNGRVCEEQRGSEVAGVEASRHDPVVGDRKGPVHGAEPHVVHQDDLRAACT